jgi:hypothetical protein
LRPQCRRCGLAPTAARPASCAEADRRRIRDRRAGCRRAAVDEVAGGGRTPAARSRRFGRTRGGTEGRLAVAAVHELVDDTVVEEPVVEGIADSVVADAVVDEIVVVEPIVDHVTEEVFDEPVVHEPVVEEPVVEESVVDEFVADSVVESRLANGF